jgi:hypothetical protein
MEEKTLSEKPKPPRLAPKRRQVITPGEKHPHTMRNPAY